MAGFLGALFRGKLGRVTGLDPAGSHLSTVAFHDVKSINLLTAPMFSLTTDRISRGSAQFVDVVHTAGLLTSIEEPIGHADFYPNGPSHPMCVQ